ncbi:hypothetical protein [Caldimonas brevitalea]|uniref:Uncharacterized protein n=1 Tax=Caldimonas brevitalea TaxID=413882 RepID=A0A0G3BL28_9BURK|nr:hypothetical protein [Caldimonas brevitalea]AKJ28688.1 hypothetical protein AAW51_1997 [Caldimonas brevitalea]
MSPDPWRHPRPALATHYLDLLADAPRRPLAVFGPRQIGKTYFLTHDLTEAAAQRGLRPLYVDLWSQSDPLGAINTALAALLRGLAAEPSRTAVTKVGALGVSVGIAPLQPLPPNADPAAWLASQFAELRRLDPNRPVLLMLDEAQTLGRTATGDAAMKAVRALFNVHPNGLLLLLTGSSRSQLLALVGDHSKTAFKLAAHMDFPLLGMEFVAFVAQRYQAASGRQVALPDLDWAFSQLLQRPGEMIDFVRYWITDAPGQTVTEALQRFKRVNSPDLVFEDLYAKCSAMQRAVLHELVGEAPQLFAKATRERIAAALGLHEPVAPASVANAIQQLETSGVLGKVQRGRYAFEDEGFRAWLKSAAG